MTYFTELLRYLSSYSYTLHILDMQDPEGLILRIGWSCLIGIELELVSIEHCCSWHSSRSMVSRMLVLVYRKGFQPLNGIHVHDDGTRLVQVLVVNILEHSYHRRIH